MLKAILVGLGGFIGSILRYLLGGFVYSLFDKPWFPYGTLVINVFGCFLIGLLSGLSEIRQVFNPEMRVFIFIGVLGGFTTFSTFGYEVFTFARDGQFLSAIVNIALHIILGLSSVWFGYSLIRMA